MFLPSTPQRRNVTTNNSYKYTTDTSCKGDVTAVCYQTKEVSNRRKDSKSDQELTKMSSSATKVQRPRLVATY